MAPKSPQRARSSNQGSPRPRVAENDKEKEEKDRKRVCKACDRCRLKKSKCDGLAPCNRCKADNGICVYGNRKKTVDKVYPKGFTDQLVMDFNMLIKAVNLLYSYHHADRKGEWDFPDIEKRGSNGTFLIHDILHTVNLLEHPAEDLDEEDLFSQDPSKLCKKFEEKAEIDRRVAELVQQRAGTPSVHDVPMLDSRSAPMSRSSSFGSLQNGTYPRLENPSPFRPVPLHDYHPAAPHPQYVMTAGPLSLSTPLQHFPPTPTESPSEENFPTQMTGSFQQSVNEMNKNKAPFANLNFPMGSQMPPAFLAPNINSWMNQTQHAFGRPQASLNQEGRDVAPMVAARRASMKMQMPMQVSAGTGSEPSLTTSAMGDTMLATANAGTQFAGDTDTWNNTNNALNSGNDPVMGDTWDDLRNEFGLTLSGTYDDT